MLLVFVLLSAVLSLLAGFGYYFFVKPQPTTPKPTTPKPTTPKPTTPKPTTLQPTTLQPTTLQPTTPQPTNIQSNKAMRTAQNNTEGEPITTKPILPLTYDPVSDFPKCKHWK